MAGGANIYLEIAAGYNLYDYVSDKCPINIQNLFEHAVFTDDLREVSLVGYCADDDMLGGEILV